MIYSRKLRQLVLLSTTLILISCVSIGTRTLPKNQRGFNGALINSTEQQLLLNLVRIQFEDRPFFLSVESITTSNSLSVSGGSSLSYSPSSGSSGGANASANGLGVLQSISASLGNSANLSKSYGFSPSASYSDSPTISYSPLQGEKFTRQMLTTISINTLYLLLDSGWNTERVMRTMLESFGDYANEAVPSRHAIPDARQFNELVQYLDELQEDKIIYYSTGLVTSISKPPKQDLYRRKISASGKGSSINKTQKKSLAVAPKLEGKAKKEARLAKKNNIKTGSHTS